MAWFMVSGVLEGKYKYFSVYFVLSRSFQQCDFRSCVRSNRCNRHFLGGWMLGVGKQAIISSIYATMPESLGIRMYVLESAF